MNIIPVLAYLTAKEVVLSYPFCVIFLSVSDSDMLYKLILGSQVNTLFGFLSL